jgi:hypothetical protein
MNYFLSTVGTFGRLQDESVEYYMFTTSTEALISRARNLCVSAAKDWGADKLLFIDADIGWTWDDMRSLIRSDKLVVGGTYPMKVNPKQPLTLNYNVLPEHSHLWSMHTLEEHERVKLLADPATGELRVMHIPTGFMMIDMRVFEKLKSRVGSYVNYWPDRPASRDYDYFPTRIKDDILESEDWAFCSICRENGIDIYLNTNIICTHTGSYTYGRR